MLWILNLLKLTGKMLATKLEAIFRATVDQFRRSQRPLGLVQRLGK